MPSLTLLILCVQLVCEVGWGAVFVGVFSIQSATVPSGHQWSVSNASSGWLVSQSANEWLLVCWLLVCHLFFKGPAGGRVAWFWNSLRDWFCIFFWYLFPGVLFGAKVAKMSQHATKKRIKNHQTSHFLLTWGTSFRYAIYQSGATLDLPGEVPKAITKTGQ